MLKRAQKHNLLDQRLRKNAERNRNGPGLTSKSENVGSNPPSQLPMMPPPKWLVRVSAGVNGIEKERICRSPLAGVPTCGDMGGARWP